MLGDEGSIEEEPEGMQEDVPESSQDAIAVAL